MKSYLSCLVDGDNNGDARDNKDAGSIDNISLNVPKDHAEQLEDVEWRQNLHQEHYKQILAISPTQ